VKTRTGLWPAEHRPPSLACTQCLSPLSQLVCAVSYIHGEQRGAVQRGTPAAAHLL